MYNFKFIFKNNTKCNNLKIEYSDSPSWDVCDVWIVCVCLVYTTGSFGGILVCATETIVNSLFFFLALMLWKNIYIYKLNYKYIVYYIIIRNYLI